MVTKKELSGFKEFLTAALQNAGYTAFGRIPSSEETFNTYAHLPEQELVTKYVEDNNLNEINRVYRIIRFIDENSGSFYSLKNLCNEQGIDYRLFAHAVENTPYVDKTGDRRKTQYHWIHKEHPSFSTAKEIVDHMRELKSTKLDKRLKDKIQQAVAKGITRTEFIKSNRIKKEATYGVEAYFNYQKLRQQKVYEVDDIAEVVPDYTPEPETSSVIPEQQPQEQEVINEEPVLVNEEVLPLPEVLDEAGLQMENFLLRQEIRYLKKINKAKDKLIKALRKNVKG